VFIDEAYYLYRPRMNGITAPKRSRNLFLFFSFFLLQADGNNRGTIWW